jgi:nucleotide-binding universal stress UspA family protein
MGNKRHESSFDFLLGHDSNQVISNATCPVLMIPQKLELSSVKRIAFALEQVDNIDSKALNFLVEFSEPFDAEIFVTHVITPKEADVSHQQLVSSFTREAVKQDYDEISFYDIQGYDITKTLLQFEQVANLDLIAVVHRKHSYVQRLFHHSVTKQLMDYHTVPLLVFPEGYQ